MVLAVQDECIRRTRNFVFLRLSLLSRVDSCIDGSVIGGIAIDGSEGRSSTGVQIGHSKLRMTRGRNHADGINGGVDKDNSRSTDERTVNQV